MSPLASPLYADLSGLPPVRVHVGDDEVLLDDSRRDVENAVAAGVDARLDLWMGMPTGSSRMWADSTPLRRRSRQAEHF
jgi:monoterpene epsilon-lactone hydrolase